MTIKPDLDRRRPFLQLRAPAKINLTLAVLGKRPDGFHEIESLVMPIGLYDHLEFTEEPDGQVRLICDEPGLSTASDNLVLKAAEVLTRHTDRPGGIQVRLTKRIPIGAGLGGGSSDAAATLMGLNRLWRLGLDRTKLTRLAAEVGSDVPLFLNSGPAILRGRGERVEPVTLGWRGWVLLVIPPFGMNTGEVYRHWCPDGSTPHPAVDIVRSVQGGETWGPLLYNMLERPAFDIEPRLAELHARMVELGAPHARMSGSGSALFALFADRGEAESFARRTAEHLTAKIYLVRATEHEHL